MSIVRVVAKPVEVEIAASSDPAEVGEVIVQAPGWLEPDPYPTYVSALTDGVVEQMLVLEGQQVKAGQVVARLVAEDAELAVQAAEAELALRRAEADAAEADLRAAKTDWDNPVERERAVAVAEAKLGELEAERIRLESTVTEHEARVAEVKQQFDRIVKLLPNATSELEVEQARLRVESLEAALAATRQQVQVVGTMISAQQAEVEAASQNRNLRVSERLQLESAQAGIARARATVKQAQAALAEAKLRLQRTQVTSPVSGVVMTRVASPGDKVMLRGDMQHSAHIVHLYDPQQLQVRVDIPLADAAKVGLNQPATVIVDVLPDQTFRGVLTRLVHKASIEKNTIEVKVSITAPAPQLKPDMLARVKFHAASHATDDSTAATQQQLRVFAPEDALQVDGSDYTAWVLHADGDGHVARRRHVTLGSHRETGWVEVVEGLRPGDVLITDAAGLEEGQRVRIHQELKP
ncbi:efflux RND transporter periplasmic adaptor subunit [Planctomycetales bacterium ZRK34]|nr:efflux RND transporter periplasmic adaptor subunit [Planctomycetales bacterium ZRK34]